MTLYEGCIAQFEPGAIALGQRHRLGHPIDAGHPPGRPFAGQGQGNRASAGAQVQYHRGEGRQ
ncbi:hypothetical protein D3C86_1811620 [compost metagenome]